MTKKAISARISKILDREAREVAKKRGITFSKLIEVSLIHELNRNQFDDGLLTELKDIQNYVTEKINNLETITETTGIKIYTTEDYINELVNKHNENGKLTPTIIQRYAEKTDITFVEMLNILNEKIEGLKLIE